MPILFSGIGIAVMTGYLFPQIPATTGLRPMLGLVFILFGVYRGLVSRMQTAREDRRRYGGESTRPWEKE